MCESLLSAARIQPHNAQRGARDAAFHLRTESRTDFNNSLGVKQMWQSKKCLKNVWSVCILKSCSCFIIHSSRQYSDYYTQLYTVSTLLAHPHWTSIESAGWGSAQSQRWFLGSDRTQRRSVCLPAPLPGSAGKWLGWAQTAPPAKWKQGCSNHNSYRAPIINLTLSIHTSSAIYQQIIH